MLYSLGLIFYKFDKFGTEFLFYFIIYLLKQHGRQSDSIKRCDRAVDTTTPFLAFYLLYTTNKITYKLFFLYTYSKRFPKKVPLKS
jgi:hypothetical protein